MASGAVFKPASKAFEYWLADDDNDDWEAADSYARGLVSQVICAFGGAIITRDAGFAHRLRVEVDGKKHDRVFAVDTERGAILEAWRPEGREIPTIVAETIPTGAVDYQGLVCVWTKPESLKVWLLCGSGGDMVEVNLLDPSEVRMPE